MDRIERIDPTSGIPPEVTAILRTARTDPDGARRDHPPQERRRPRARRPVDPQPDDGHQHVDVRA